MQEKDVEKSVAQYLKRENYFVLQQFETREGRVDVAAFKWITSYEIDSIGVECKATTNPKTIMKILLEQIFSYQKNFPKVYLAIPEGGDHQTITNLCESSKVGYITVDSNKNAKISLDAPELTPAFDDASYGSEVFARAVMFLTFMSIFGDEFISGRRWISTKGDVGYHLVQDPDSTVLGVNLEDSRKVLVNVREKNLYAVLRKQTPKDARLWFAKEKYFGRGFRTSLTFINKSVGGVKPEDVAYIFHATKSERTNLHLGVHTEVWKNWEQLDRETYAERVRKAKADLSPLYAVLKGSNNTR